MAPEAGSLVFKQYRDSRSHVEGTGNGDTITKALSSQKKRSHQTNALILSGNFKEGALSNMNNSGAPGAKGVTTSSDYISSSHVLQPPFYTQANAAAGMGSGLIKASLSTSQQASELQNILQRNNFAKYEMQMQLQNSSKKELRSQLTLDPGDECVAYGSKERVDEGK